MPKRPRDFNQLAKKVADMTTGAARNDSHDEPSGRARGGYARAAKLSPERRREIARNASEASRQDDQAGG